VEITTSQCQRATTVNRLRKPPNKFEVARMRCSVGFSLMLVPTR